MSSSTASIFTGTSTFSSDFSQVVSRAVSIASLPIDALNSAKTTLTAEQTALSNLSGAFSNLQTALSSVVSSISAENWSVSYSDASVASASAGSGALPGTYSLEVVDAGSQARAASLSTVTDPSTQSISSAASFTLTANGQTYTNIMPPPGANTLTSLVSAINTTTQGAVQATIVNVGTPSQPNYQLSIQNSAFGDLPITLDDGSGNLLATQSAASPVQYRINGQPADTEDPLTTDTRTLTIAPHLAVSVQAAGSTEIRLTQDTSKIATAMSGFVTAYNSAAQALGAHSGTAGGALSGQSVIHILSQSLSEIANYGATGTIQSIADLGLTFASDGTLSFDSSVLSAASSQDRAGVAGFLGDGKTTGFLKAASTVLSGIIDSTSGPIAVGLSTIGGEITYTNDQISRNQDRVDELQKNLTAQISAADALIAQMQQQATYMTNLLDAMIANQNSMK